MFDKATSGIEPNNDQFSVCSKDSIKQNINRHRSKQDSTCFIKADEPICGNKIVERGEQCDCGDTETCTEDCCEPASTDPSKPRINQCKLKVGKICSPSQGLQFCGVLKLNSATMIHPMMSICVYCGFSFHDTIVNIDTVSSSSSSSPVPSPCVGNKAGNQPSFPSISAIYNSGSQPMMNSCNSFSTVHLHVYFGRPMHRPCPLVGKGRAWAPFLLYL